MNAFNEWLDANHGGRGYEVKYYKGLGSSTPQEGKEYFKNFKLVTYHWDDDAGANIDLAFNKKRADDRKAWLKTYDENSILDINQSRVTFSDFVNKDLIHFSEYDNHRSIPNIFDGLKPSQRKIMYCCFKRGLTNEIKVAQLAGYVSEHGAYHHGEASLNGAIINLAQNYVGTNNVNLLMPEGQFGSRILAGADSAAPRYIYTYLSKITNVIFNKDDMQLLKYNIDDGQTIEPVFYMATVPVILINGTTGIGTGWSTEIPQFNPIDIVANLRHLMAGKPIIPMNPWYRGFKGTIKRLSPNRWLTKGTYQIINNSTIEISELPIGCWTQDFKNMLDTYENGYRSDVAPDRKKSATPKGTSSSSTTMATAKAKQKPIGDSKKPKWAEYADINGRLIKSYHSECSESQIKFTITFESDILNRLLDGYDKNGTNELEKIFGLTTSITCENTQNLYDEHNKLRNFKNVEDILQYYYDYRIHYYELRRKHLIKILKGEVLLISTRAAFILDVIKEAIKVRNIPKSEVVKQLERLKYPKMVSKVLTSLDDIPDDEVDTHANGYDFLVGMPIYSLTKEKVDELLKEKDVKTAELEILNVKTDKILWEEDLQVFEREYRKHMDDFYDYMALDPKQFEGRPARSINRAVTISKKSKSKSDVAELVEVTEVTEITDVDS
jgi:DNA topoisomerase-2